MTTAEVKCSAQRKKGLVYKLHLRPVLSILVRRFSQLHRKAEIVSAKRCSLRYLYFTEARIHRSVIPCRSFFSFGCHLRRIQTRQSIFLFFIFILFQGVNLDLYPGLSGRHAFLLLVKNKLLSWRSSTKLYQ